MLNPVDSSDNRYSCPLILLSWLRECGGLTDEDIKKRSQLDLEYILSLMLNHLTSDWYLVLLSEFIWKHPLMGTVHLEIFLSEKMIRKVTHRIKGFPLQNEKLKNYSVWLDLSGWVKKLNFLLIFQEKFQKTTL